jgi:anti-anti-sigma factor
MPPLCTVDVASPSARATVVRLAGELDLSNVDEIEGRLLAALRPGHVLVLDLSQLGYIDSSGLGVIERLTHRTDLRLVLPAEAVIARTITITGLDQLVGVFATETEALHD